MLTEILRLVLSSVPFWARFPTLNFQLPFGLTERSPWSFSQKRLHFLGFGWVQELREHPGACAERSPRAQGPPSSFLCLVLHVRGQPAFVPVGPRRIPWELGAGEQRGCLPAEGAGRKVCGLIKLSPWLILYERSDLPQHTR